MDSEMLRHSHSAAAQSGLRGGEREWGPQTSHKVSTCSWITGAGFCLKCPPGRFGRKGQQHSWVKAPYAVISPANPASLSRNTSPDTEDRWSSWSQGALGNPGQDLLLWMGFLISNRKGLHHQFCRYVSHGNKILDSANGSGVLSPYCTPGTSLGVPHVLIHLMLKTIL